MKKTEQNYSIAKSVFADYGCDCDEVLRQLDQIPLSIHCWQLDDLKGFEVERHALSGGIAVTGDLPCRAQDQDSYFHEMEKVLAYVPGKNKVALHAMYLDTQGEKVDRNQIEPKHFDRWIRFAQTQHIGLDFNPSYFSHEMAKSGFTLSSMDDTVRQFWIEHGKRSRKVASYIGKQLRQTCYTNHWIPDGYKDMCADTLGPRQRLAQSLDEIFSEKLEYNVDSVESKLFGLGSESYVTGSHEFYTNYVANRKNAIICLDVGHFHPTESVAAKISSYLAFGQEIMLHVSRPVRWDSDHIVIQDEETLNIMREIKRAGAWDTVHIGLDFFDGTVERGAATIIGARSARQCMLRALLEPSKLLQQAEYQGDYTRRLAKMEELRNLPYSFVWDRYCEMHGMPGTQWYECYCREES